MISRVLVDDPEMQKRVIHHYDGAAGKMHIETVQEVDDILDATHAERGAHSDYRPYSHGDWHKVASIPLSLYMDLKKQGIVEDQAAMKRWLNDRDNQLFRTMPGRV